MHIHISEFQSILTIVCISLGSKHRSNICPGFRRETLVTHSHADGRREPFSEIGIYARAERRLITFIQEKIDTASHTYEPVVTKTVCFIWASNDLAILIPVPILLSIHSRRHCHRDSHKSRSSNKIIKTFHNH